MWRFSSCYWAGGAVAAYAYDSSRSDRIAEGVTVAGTDVGGMTTAEARRVRLVRDLKEPLEQPVAVVYKGKRFNLSAEDAGVTADVGGMVDEAVAQSREGNIISRVTRDLTGGEASVQVAARVSYSEDAVNKLVRRVKRRLDRPARDAEVSFPSLDEVKEQTGVRVKREVLKQRIAQALTVPGVDRRVKATVAVVQPKVTQAELATKYPVLLVADRNAFQLRLYKDLQLQKQYTVAVGALGFDTPARTTTSRTRRWTPPGPCPTATGRATSPAPWCGRRAREPAQGALARHIRRRRHPRHRPDLLARQRRLTRLHPDGDPGRDRAVRPGPRRRANLDSPTARGRRCLRHRLSPCSARLRACFLGIDPR